MIALPSEKIRQVHYHDSFEFGVCLQGSGHFISFERVEPIWQGDAILIVPGVSHYSHSLDNCRCLFLFADPVGLFRMLGVTDEKLLSFFSECAQMDSPMILRKSEYPEINETIRRMINGYGTAWSANGKWKLETAVPLSAGTGAYPQAVLNACRLLAARISELLILCRDCFPQRERSVSENSHLIPAIEHISLNYNKHLNINELAELCHISRSTLRREFLKDYRITPFAYLTKFRCRTAEMLLLHTDCPIGEIAVQVGYKDPSDFYRNFLAWEGVTPLEYRKKHKNRPCG